MSNRFHQAPAGKRSCQALLLNPSRTISTQHSVQGTLFDFSDFEEAATAKGKVTRKLDDAAEREKASRPAC